MVEKWRLCHSGRKVKDTIRFSVPLFPFKWESFYGIILYKAEHRNNSRRSQRLMETPDEEIPLHQCWENMSLISPALLTGLLQWTQIEKQQLGQIISSTWEIPSHRITERVRLEGNTGSQSSVPTSLLRQGHPAAHGTELCPDNSWTSPVKQIWGVPRNPLLCQHSIQTLRTIMKYWQRLSSAFPPVWLFLTLYKNLANIFFQS